jgi:hypothetical protein
MMLQERCRLLTCGDAAADMNTIFRAYVKDVGLKPLLHLLLLKYLLHSLSGYAQNVLMATPITQNACSVVVLRQRIVLPVPSAEL